MVIQERLHTWKSFILTAQCFSILAKRKQQRPSLTQYVVELVQVVFPRKDRLVGQHLSQDAAH